MDVDVREEGQEVPPPCHPRTAEEGQGQSDGPSDLGHMGLHGAACGSAPRSGGRYSWEQGGGSGSEDEDGSDSLMQGPADLEGGGGKAGDEETEDEEQGVEEEGFDMEVEESL